MKREGSIIRVLVKYIYVCYIYTYEKNTSSTGISIYLNQIHNRKSGGEIYFSRRCTIIKYGFNRLDLSRDINAATNFFRLQFLFFNLTPLHPHFYRIYWVRGSFANLAPWPTRCTGTLSARYDYEKSQKALNHFRYLPRTKKIEPLESDETIHFFYLKIVSSLLQLHL